MVRVPQPLPQTCNYKMNFIWTKYSWTLIGQGSNLKPWQKGGGSQPDPVWGWTSTEMPCGCSNDLQTIGILFHKDNIITIKHWFACSLCETKPKLNASSLVPRSQLLARGYSYTHPAVSLIPRLLLGMERGNEPGNEATLQWRGTSYKQNYDYSG